MRNIRIDANKMSLMNSDLSNLSMILYYFFDDDYFLLFNVLSSE